MNGEFKEGDPFTLMIWVSRPGGSYIGFFSNLVGEEGPRIQGVKDSRVYYLKTLSALLAFIRFL